MKTAENSINIFGQIPPEIDLFHYSSAEGLKGIVGGRSLWATNIEYLNDAAEFRHGEGVIEEIVAKRKSAAKGEEESFFERLGESPRIFDAPDIFVVSLSESDDSLGQWRGYTPSNCGFSIGFDSRVLTSALWASDSMQLVRCIYGDEEQRQTARDLLETHIEGWIKRPKTPSGIRNSSAKVSAALSFRVQSAILAASMKHRAFSDEKEWRLLGVFRDTTNYRFRAGKSSLIPYIELRWGAGTNAPEAQPIRSVTVGPSPNPKLGNNSVSLLLKSLGMDHVRIKSSQIPFRSW